MSPKNDKNRKFKDLSTVGIQIIVKTGDSLLYKKTRFLET